MLVIEFALVVGVGLFTDDDNGVVINELVNCFVSLDCFSRFADVVVVTVVVVAAAAAVVAVADVLLLSTTKTATNNLSIQN